MIRNLAIQIRQSDSASFENLVDLALKAKFPGSGIRKVEGAGGDKGLDSFSGSLIDGPAIWQAKAFASGRLGPSQKKQVLKSLATALLHKPKRWTLCIPFDLSFNEHRWFQEKIEQVHPDVNIQLMQGSDFLDILVNNRHLLETCFPENVLSTALAVQSNVLNGNSTRTLQEKQQLMVAHVLDTMAVYERLEPRLRPIATVATRVQKGWEGAQPGAIFRSTDNNLTIDFLPKNPLEYALDPLTMSFTVDARSSHDLEEAIDFGRTVRLSAGNIRTIGSDSPLIRLLFADINAEQLELHIQPTINPQIANRIVPLKMKAGTGAAAFTIDYLPMRVMRAGRKEIEFATVEPSALRASLILPLNQLEQATLNFSLNGLNVMASEYLLAIEFVSQLKVSGVLSVSMLQPALPLLVASGISGGDISVDPAFEALIRDLDLITKHFGVPIPVPLNISRHDRENIDTLKRIATGDAFEVNSLSSQMKKQQCFEERMMSFFDNPRCALLIKHLAGWQIIDLFGVKIDCGLISLQADDIVLLNVAETRRAYLQALEGESVPLQIRALTPLRFVRSS